MEALLRDPCCIAGLTVVGLFAVGAMVTAASRFVIGLFRRKRIAEAEGEHETS